MYNSNIAKIDVKSIRLNSSKLENQPHFTLLALEVCPIAYLLTPHPDI